MNTEKIKKTIKIEDAEVDKMNTTLPSLYKKDNKSKQKTAGYKRRGVDLNINMKTLEPWKQENNG